MERKQIAQNKRARFDYFIEETIEAGIMLLGSEVKSLRLGKASIGESYASEEEDGSLFLINASITPYTQANRFNHEERRPRKLLLRRRQLDKLLNAIRRKGKTLVPLSLYFNERGIVKVELGLAAGKKKQDKRSTEKERDWNRDKARIMRDKG